MCKPSADLADIHFVRQGQPLGLGHAVLMAQAHTRPAACGDVGDDDIMHVKSGILQGMLAAHERHGTSVLALKKVERAEIVRRERGGYRRGGVVRPGNDLVEKPTPEEAPSNLGPRDVTALTPGIFEAIAQTQPGRGGEIQLTDAIKGQAGH